MLYYLAFLCPTIKIILKKITIALGSNPQFFKILNAFVKSNVNSKLTSSLDFLLQIFYI